MWPPVYLHKEVGPQQNKKSICHPFQQPWICTKDYPTPKGGSNILSHGSWALIRQGNGRCNMSVTLDMPLYAHKHGLGPNKTRKSQMPSISVIFALLLSIHKHGDNIRTSIYKRLSGVMAMLGCSLEDFTGISGVRQEGLMFTMLGVTGL